jgi:nucleoid DNA-binding protein
MTAREKIIRILMRRDDLSREEAEEAFLEGMEIVHEAIVDGSDVEEAFTEAFGLEPDYLFDLI